MHLHCIILVFCLLLIKVACYSAAKDVLKGLQTIKKINACDWFQVKQVGRKLPRCTQNLNYYLLPTNRRNLFLLKHAYVLSHNHIYLREEHSKSLRSNRKILLKEPRSKSKHFDKCFLFKSVKMWNKLPEDCKKIRNIYRFKTRVKLEMLNNNINFRWMTIFSLMDRVWGFCFLYELIVF